jgi:glycosyltransferase involved in cell wall biosynthesis
MSFLAHVTPVILTYNEAPNIGRVLERLSWARDIVVVDSGSTDETREICARHSAVRVFERPFDTHAAQWNFAISQTAITSSWVLSLDADYIMTDAALAEIGSLPLGGPTAAYWLSFRYAIEGKVLRSGVYPPVLALFRNGAARYVQDGHTQRLQADGPTGRIAAPILHDDRKSLDRWLKSQLAYARLEAEKTEAAGFRGFLRTRTPFAPLAVAIHVLILNGAAFEGRAGWYYAAQRTLAEALILCARLDRMLRGA